MEELQPKEETREDKPEQTVVMTHQKSLKKMAKDAAISGIVIYICIPIIIMIQVVAMGNGGFRLGSYASKFLLMWSGLIMAALGIAYMVYYIIITVKYGQIRGNDDVVHILLIVGIVVPILDVVALFMCTAAEEKRVPIEQKIIK